MSVCCVSCVLSGRGLCHGLIIRPEESYRLWCVCECDSKSQEWGGLGPPGALTPWNKKVIYVVFFPNFSLQPLSPFPSSIYIRQPPTSHH
jgi:hypothetical protein